MTDVRSILKELIKQLDVSDAYAAQDNASPVRSVWQLQNGHLLILAQDALASATSSIT